MMLDHHLEIWTSCRQHQLVCPDLLTLQLQYDISQQAISPHLEHGLERIREILGHLEVHLPSALVLHRLPRLETVAMARLGCLCGASGLAISVSSITHGCNIKH